MTRSYSSRGIRGDKSFSAFLEAWLVAGAIALTVWLVQSGMLASAIHFTAVYGPLSGFIAGLLYSTFITTPVAIGVLAEIGTISPIWQTAFVGAIGAMLVDLVLIRGMRSPLTEIIFQAAFGPHVMHTSKRLAKGRFRWLAMLLGGLLIAIPLPTDELGIAMLGASHIQSWKLAPLIFVADFIGIYALVAAFGIFL